jgi:CHAT domain-containing protein
MSKTESAIISLAKQVFAQRLSLDTALRDCVPALIQKGIPLDDLIDAQLMAVDSGCPPLLRSYIGKVCAEVLTKGMPATSLPPIFAQVLNPSTIHLAVAGSLAERDDLQSLQLATEHYWAARRRLDPTSEEYSGSLVDEGDVRRHLAEFGVDPLYNLERAVEYAQQARRHFTSDSHGFGVAAMNEGIAHDLLANLGVNPREHLEHAIRLYREARALFSPETEEFANTQLNEAASCVYLAELAVDPLGTLHTAVDLCEAARQSLAGSGRAFGLTLLNEAQARRGLAEWGERPVDNLRAAVFLLRQARPRFEPNGHDWRLVLAGEVGTLRDLASAGVDDLPNLKAALELVEDLRKSYAPGTLTRAEQDITAADLRIALARHGVMARFNLDVAIQLCQEARGGFDPTGHTHSRAATSEGHARLLLAEHGVRHDENCRLAFALYEQSEHGHAIGSSGWAVARRNASRALSRLGGFAEAYERLASGLAALDVGRSGLRTERERVAFAQAVSGQYQDAARMCLDALAHERDEKQKGHWLREAWHQVHRAKNRALLDLLRGARPRLRVYEQALWEDLESLYERLDECANMIRALHRVATISASAEATRRLNELLSEQSALTRSVEARRARALREIEGADTFLSVDVPPVEDVRKDLRRLAEQGGGQARRPLLVEFFLLDTGTVLVFFAPLWEPEHLEVEQIALPPSFTRQLTERLVAATDPDARAQTRATQATFEQLLDEMAVFVEPLAPRLDSCQPTELVISPHSLLNLLPLHAIPLRGEPLIERMPVTYLPTPTLAKALCWEGAREVETALLIGNPTGNLPDAEMEVLGLAELFGAAGNDVMCFTGKEAVSERLWTHASGANVVHLACHSVLDHADFLRSGFMFNDRRITVLEIMSTLDLQRATLAYLSSCDSARPVAGRTEELMALARSFLYAGSPTVIASLWPLRDVAGRVFAESFYRSWLVERVSPAQAFQRATLQTRETEPDPIDWAPFIMVGRGVL